MNQIFKDLAVMIHDQGEMIGEWLGRFCCVIVLLRRESVWKTGALLTTVAATVDIGIDQNSG